MSETGFNFGITILGVVVLLLAVVGTYMCGRMCERGRQQKKRQMSTQSIVYKYRRSGTLSPPSGNNEHQIVIVTPSPPLDTPCQCHIYTCAAPIGQIPAEGSRVIPSELGCHGYGLMTSSGSRTPSCRSASTANTARDVSRLQCQTTHDSRPVSGHQGYGHCGCQDTVPSVTLVTSSNDLLTARHPHSLSTCSGYGTNSDTGSDFLLPGMTPDTSDAEEVTSSRSVQQTPRPSLGDW